MELRSRVLAEVESGDMSLGVSTFSTLLTEGSGELVPVCVVSSSSVEEIAVAWGKSFTPRRRSIRPCYSPEGPDR